MRQISLPYVRVNKIIDFLLLIYDNPNNTFDSLASKNIALTRTNLQNQAYSAKSLNLVTIHRKTTKLTKQGKIFVEYIRKDNKKNAKDTLQKIIQKNEALSMILGLLKKEKTLTMTQIGVSLADKYKKIWKHEKTFITYGVSCASIIDFAGLGVISRNLLSLPEIKQTERIYIPELRLTRALLIIKEIFDSKQINFKHLSEKVVTHRDKLIAEIAGLIELGLIQKLDNNLYSTTINGSRILNPLEAEKKKKILKECILSSKFEDFVYSLLGREFTTFDLGLLLDFQFHRRWKEEHTRRMGSVFLNWLKEADLVKKIDKSKYILNLINPSEAYSDLEYAEKNLYYKMYPPALVMCRRAYEGILIKKYRLITGKEPITKKTCRKCNTEIGQFPMSISVLHQWAVDNGFIPEQFRGVGHILAKVGVIGAHPYEKSLDPEDAELQIAQTKLLIKKILKN